MADHQPAMRAQHRDVVGDVLGVGRADADVDQADAAPVGAHEVIGGHLEAMPDDAVAMSLSASSAGVTRSIDHVARQHQLLDAIARAQLLRDPSARTGRHSGDSWSAAPRAASRASPSRCNAPAAAANSRRARASNSASGRSAPGRISNSPSAISSPITASEGAGKWRAMSDAVDAAARRARRRSRTHRGRRSPVAPTPTSISAPIFVDQRLQLLEQIGAEILGLRHRRRIDARARRIWRRRAALAGGAPSER